MPNPPLAPDRRALSEVFKDPRTLRAFESLFQTVSGGLLNTTPVTASEDIPAGSLINLYAGGMRKADKVLGRPAHGFVDQAVTAGNGAAPQFSGMMTGLSGLTIGPVYLGAAGAISTARGVAPDIDQMVGVALSPSVAFFALEETDNPFNVGAVTVESGTGVPTRTDRAVGSLWFREDVAQVWQYSDAASVAVSGANIVGTNLKTGTNIVTLSGYATTDVLTFSKPSVATSGGLLSWDAYSLWDNDAGIGPSGNSGVPGQTYSNAVSIYGNNGGADVLLFAATMSSGLYATAAAAFAALAAQMPVTVTGYGAYKMVGYIDSIAADNRGGLSLRVEARTPGWVLMSDLTSIRLNGTEIEGAARSLNVVDANGVLTAASDGAGAVSLTLNTDTDATMAANSNARVATQAATKAAISAAIAGLSWKQAVRAGTTANITLSGTQTIDGVSVVAGDRVLVKNQTTASQNGIYVAASGSWTRATDADAGAELVNATCYVSEGTTLADTQWTCSTNAPITVGTTSLTFAQLSSGTGTAITAKDEGSTLTSSMTSIDFVGAGVAATNTGGAVTVTVSGGGGGAATYYPSVTYPILGNFAWVNQGASTATTLSYGPINLRAPGGVTTNNVRALVASLPTPPYTVTFAFIPSHQAINWQFAGFAWRESSSGKLIVTGAYRDTGSALWLTQKFPSPTSAQTNVASVNVPWTFNGIVFGKITDDGTTLTASFGWDPGYMKQVYSESRTAFMTPDQIGIFINNANQSGSTEMSMTLISWAVS